MNKKKVMKTRKERGTKVGNEQRITKGKRYLKSTLSCLVVCVDDGRKEGRKTQEKGEADGLLCLYKPSVMDDRFLPVCCFAPFVYSRRKTRPSDDDDCFFFFVSTSLAHCPLLIHFEQCLFC